MSSPKKGETNMKIKKGDNVKVLKGKDKGKTGTVLTAYPAVDMVLVENVNQYKKHKKARMQGETSEIVTITKPLHVSNVALIDPTTKKVTRVGYSIIGDKKVRIAKKSGQELK
jgi:large subunit ribosomal protein L24